MLGQNVAVLHRLLDLSVGKLEETENFRLLAAEEMKKKISLRKWVIPSFEEDLLRHFEFVVSLLADSFEAAHEG